VFQSMIEALPSDQLLDLLTFLKRIANSSGNGGDTKTRYADAPTVNDQIAAINDEFEFRNGMHKLVKIIWPSKKS